MKDYKALRLLLALTQIVFAVVAAIGFVVIFVGWGLIIPMAEQWKTILGFAMFITYGGFLILGQSIINLMNLVVDQADQIKKGVDYLEEINAHFKRVEHRIRNNS